MSTGTVKKERVQKLSREGAAKVLSTLPIGVLHCYRLDVGGIKPCGDPDLVISISRCLHSTGSPAFPYPSSIEDVMVHAGYYLSASKFDKLELLLNKVDTLALNDMALHVSGAFNCEL